MPAFLSYSSDVSLLLEATEHDIIVSLYPRLTAIRKQHVAESNTLEAAAVNAAR